MFSQIPQSRLVLYILAAGLLPLLLALTYSLSMTGDGANLLELTEDLQDRAVTVEARRAPNRQIIALHVGSDQLYVHKYLESLHLLEDEIEQLKAILKLDTLGVNEDFQTRLDFLTNENRFDFDEGETRALGNMKEYIRSTTRPAEVSNKDLMKILALIEGVTIGPFHPAPERPELLITDCKINRKKGVGESEVFDLSLRLIQREFTTK